MATISRFKDTKKDVIKAILHPKEVKAFSQSQNKPLFLATRWAIKEALFKADNKLSHFSKINVAMQNQQYYYPGYKISTTKEGDYYIAIVMKV